MNKQTAIKYRKFIEQAAASLPDIDALQVPEIYPHWRKNITLNINERIYYNDILYRVIQTHVTQNGWEPDKAPALFAEILIPDEKVIPEWKQPDSTNGYSIGDKVMFQDKVYESLINNNIWSPAAYPQGWREVTV